MRNSHVFPIYTVILALLCITGCANPPWATKQKPQKGVRIIRQLQGDHLSFSEPTIKLINDHNELFALGIDELSDLRANFRQHSLLIVAAGQKPTSGYWIYVTGLQVQGESLFFQGMANKPSQADMVAQVLTYPYTAVLISKVRAQRVHPEIESVTGADPPQ